MGELPDDCADNLPMGTRLWAQGCGHLICRWADILDHQVDHASQVGILVLKQLCDAEEDLRRLFLQDMHAAQNMAAAQVLLQSSAPQGHLGKMLAMTHMHGERQQGHGPSITLLNVSP